MPATRGRACMPDVFRTVVGELEDTWRQRVEALRQCAGDGIARHAQWTPTLAAKETKAAALPPKGAKLAPWDGPAVLTMAP